MNELLNISETVLRQMKLMRKTGFYTVSLAHYSVKISKCHEF
jgi:hypothetical protein